MLVRLAMWRTCLVNDGDEERPDWQQRDWPHSCDACPEEQRERYGCGWDDRTRGHGRAEILGGVVCETCPQWCALQPAVASVYELLGDYREGRLGPVQELPRALLEYLRFASAELESWLRVQQQIVVDHDRENRTRQNRSCG